MLSPSRESLPLFLKWAGGKSQLIEQFESLFPPSFSKYCEPFVGSGAVFFHVKSNLKPDKVILSDINEELINCFIAVRDNPHGLIELLFNHKNNHSKKYYYAVRSIEYNRLNSIESAARLIYLNKSCFNGLYRVNSRGEFNVPFGDIHNPRIYDKKKLLQASQLLQGVELRVMTFEKVLDLAERNDFIYLDPPYFPLSKTSSFTKYSKADFALMEQKRLSEVFRMLDSRGCLVMLSNSDHPVVRELYEDYMNYAVMVRAKRLINSVGNRRGPINEMVIRNYNRDKVASLSREVK
jgi:DNA adenine methylase